MQGSLKAFTAATRQQLRIALSRCTMQPIEKVSIESMKAAPNSDRGIRVCVHVQLVRCHSTPDQLTAACRATLLDMVTEDEAMLRVLAAFGQVDPDTLQINLIDELPEDRQTQISPAVIPPMLETGGKVIEVNYLINLAVHVDVAIQLLDDTGTS